MNKPHDTWPSGWLEHEQQQLERQANLPFEDKLRWLEQAHKMVLRLQQNTTSSTRSEEKEHTTQ